VPSVKYIEYDLSNGKIVLSSSVSGVEMPVNAGYGRIYGTYAPDEYYVDITTTEVKTKIPFAVSSVHNGSNIVISNLPINTSVMIDGDQYIVEDGVLEMTLDQPIEITYWLDHPHYITEVNTLESP